ncbi:MAG: NAD(P)H-hydrate dehydratase [Gammaproteobacteria bacterium]|nr:MAG: NAD(P)H-hydrate dehydratase [Gammaproteobacteria bacterium]
MSSDKTSLPKTLYLSAQVRELDRIAIEEFSIPSMTLMENAGASAYQLMRSKWPDAKCIHVLCGPGNNGGDGYILARLANEDDLLVKLHQVGNHEKLSGDALQAAERCITSGLEPVQYAFGHDFGGKLNDCDVIVDALLGTGLDREVTGQWQEVINTINRCDIPVLSLDIPSGLNADTGRVMGCAVHAKATMTFIGLKQGLFTGQGVEYAGDVHFDKLDVPDGVLTKIVSMTKRITLDDLQSLLKPRSKSSHKGNYGHVLVVGGDQGFAGAARLSAEAAARTGAGLVSLATHANHAALITMGVPEIMAHSIENSIEIKPLLGKASVVAIGPGLGQSTWGSSLFSKVLEGKLPLVVDADALNILAREPVSSDRWILTPHPGEAARLLNCEPRDIQSDRVSAASEIQKKYGGIVVLKGSGSIIADDEGNISICSEGNPGMASGGMGDVLTGIIAGLSAQGLEKGDAARLGVCIHAAAADNAAVDGERGLLASDLMPWIRRLVSGHPS